MASGPYMRKVYVPRSDLTSKRKTQPPFTDGLLKSVSLDGTIILEIGPDRLKYYVHKALLVHYSEYFRNALKGPWKEAEEGVVKLVDVQPAAVNIFMHWLYIQDLPREHDFRAWEDILARERQTNFEIAMIRAYAFADRFLIPTFRRAINKTIVEYFKCGDPALVCNIPDLATEAFSKIPADRPILQFLVDEYCYWWTVGCETSDPPINLKEAPPAFLARSVRSYRTLLEYSRAGNGVNQCCYYEHTDEQEASACGKLHM
ncbi:hypothetical protein HBH55_208580 [Parastagonospora nodorum]|nr:hypothetical protein HBH55_208580 [Parastagonospora nodorum]